MSTATALKPYFQRNRATLYLGDVMDVLRQMPSESVHCAITSPPYWGLRDYGTVTWEGGDPACEHTISGWNDSMKPGVDRPERNGEKRQACLKCGVRRIDQQIGLEATPAAYVKRMVEVFGELRRVLRDDGTLWLNLGDSYYGGREKSELAMLRARIDGLKPKDLCMIPARVALALQADGWWLRSDIIWAKPNPMPESVTDRPTKSYEHMFLLAKSERYYYDADAVREEATSAEHHNRYHEAGQHYQQWSPPGQARQSNAAMMGVNPLGRNKRDVWTIPTAAFSEAHFATFPPDLVKPCVLAGCPEGGTVLDPFAGSGTTLMVAQQLGRYGVGIELNREYADIAARRLAQEVLAW